MKVRIPSPLHSYTGGASHVTADGTTAAEVIEDLDRQFPGVAFRIVDEQGGLRQHVNVWADGDRVRDLGRSVVDVDELVIMQALSGGMA